MLIARTDALDIASLDGRRIARAGDLALVGLLVCSVVELAVPAASIKLRAFHLGAGGQNDDQGR
jgi:hypothetical protein